MTDKKLLPPIFPVEAAILNRLRQVAHLDALGAFQVGDGAGNFQDAVVGTGGEAEPLHGGLQDGEAGGVGHGELMQQLGVHLGVAMDALVDGEPLRLHLTGGDDPLAHGGARLAGLPLGYLLERKRLRHL